MLESVLYVIKHDVSRLIISVLVASIIGLERSISKKTVGIRTLSLVCVGSTLATIISLNNFPHESGRVFAGIVTGLGFLGAGAILAHGNTIKGLTTAASIWAVAILGVCIGLGNYVLAISSSILIFLILIFRETSFVNNLKKKYLKIRKFHNND